MTKLKQLFITLAVALGLLVPAATATPASAAAGQHATNCTIIGGTNSTSVTCTAYDYVAGYTGIYKARVTCWVGSVPHNYDGPWRTIGQSSTVYCVQGVARAMPSADHSVIKA